MPLLGVEFVSRIRTFLIADELDADTWYFTNSTANDSSS